MSGRVAAALLLMTFAAAWGLVAAELPARDLWTQANAAADSGDFEEANRKLNELIEQGLQTGLERYPLLAKSAAGLAERAHSEGNAALSEWSMGAAERLDPELPGIWFARADLARHQGDWVGAARAVLTGLGSVRSDTRSSVLARNDLIMVVVLAIGLMAVVFGAILFFRYGRSAAHDFRETLSGRFSAGGTTVFAFAILFLPLFFWLGPTWLVLWWLALFFAYGTWSEKAATAVLLILVALTPLILARAAWRVAGVQSPVVHAAMAATERAWDPTALLRLQALIEYLPEDPVLHLLAGNLYVLQGSDNDAVIHYRRAVQLDDSIAGAHLNIGNLHFLNNDFTAAISRYERAADADPRLAIASYNHSVAAGELYRFDEQREKIDEARQRDRALIDRLTSASSRSGLDVVLYELPIDQAWRHAEQIARRGDARELYGNFAWFDPLPQLTTPLAIGALAALLVGLALWALRRRSGLAGACIKCGRTFCHRCKSARESATYCTQCIHIYLKRDGVSADTKRRKLMEVQDYQSRTVRLRKLLGTVLPGAPQLLSGSVLAGAVILLAFLAFASLAFLIGRLAPLGPSSDTMRLFVRGLAIATALLVWLIFSLPVYRERAGQ
ncbi:MAG TPA: tetratricopeptide repeat protein [Thermoanaerobaculia bacterium]|nr:tetratricopeptide repeat protein [Thermoanaerobaculia bacterium]